MYLKILFNVQKLVWCQSHGLYLGILSLMVIRNCLLKNPTRKTRIIDSWKMIFWIKFLFKIKFIALFYQFFHFYHFKLFNWTSTSGFEAILNCLYLLFWLSLSWFFLLFYIFLPDSNNHYFDHSGEVATNFSLQFFNQIYIKPLQFALQQLKTDWWFTTSYYLNININFE